jgi:hypothetical protein
MDLLAPLEMVGLGCVVASLLLRRQAHRWPALFSALVLELSTDVVLLWLIHHPGHYTPYFYIFWISSGLQAILRIWIIGDIVKSFPSIDFLPYSVYFFVGVAGVVMAAASATYCFQGSSQLPQDLVGSVVLMNRCVNIAWISFTAVILCSIKFLNLGWSQQGARITTGVVLRLCSIALVSELLTHPSPRLRSAANGFDSICSIAVCFFWVYCISRNPRLPSAPTEGDCLTLPDRSGPMLLFIQGRER